MIFSIRKWIGRAKFIVMFVFLTYLLYHVMTIISGWIEPLDKYRHPSGNSVKVFQHRGVLQESDSMSERLRLFYWYGG
ncbi:DUF4227 family protein [Paenibacillus sp. KN14-4R]|uniref:DUF4227 family protein n=1 Tax=Paenibacillus sp. KN14-4R TaxID=3445773 RepID=UPI003FA115E0